MAIFFPVEMLWQVYGWPAHLHLFANTVFGAIQDNRGPESTLEGNSSQGCAVLPAWGGGRGGCEDWVSLPRGDSTRNVGSLCKLEKA